MSDRKQQLIQRFRASAIERLRKIDLELGHVEAESSASPNVVSTLRELHTIKGESRMLGLPAVSNIAHLLEDLLRPIAQQNGPFEPDTLRNCRRGLTSLITVMNEAEMDEAVLSAALAVTNEELQSAIGSPVSSSLSFKPAQEASSSTVPQPEARSNQEHSSGAVSPQVSTSVPLEPSGNDEIHRWVHVSSQKIDALCESTAELETVFHALFAQAQVTLAEKSPRGEDLRALREEMDRCRVRIEEVTGMVWALQLVPVEPVLVDLAQHAEDLARSQGKRVRVRIQSGSAQLERSVLDSLWDPLLHLVRNAIDHGVEQPIDRGGKPAEATLILGAESHGATLVITVGDDGRGIDAALVRNAAVARNLLSRPAADALSDAQIYGFLFRHGFSTKSTVTDISGRGIGLDVVRSAVERVGGSVELTSTFGAGTHFYLTVPARLSRERALVFSYQGTLYAIPARQVLDVLNLNSQTVRSVVGGRALWSRHGILPLLSMTTALGITGPKAQTIAEPHVIIVSTSSGPNAFSVGGIIGECELVRKPCDPLTAASSGSTASATLDDGRLVLYVNPVDLLRRVHQASSAAFEQPLAQTHRVLVVDDSAIIRHLVTQVLGAGGYSTSSAENGRQALSMCESQLPSLMLSDLDMPEMDGLELLSNVRKRWPSLPVIIFSSNAGTEARERARELGAQAYIVKSNLDHEALRATVDRVLGRQREDS